ncbi:hypothetical protein K1719_038928 [Acacia pycnantha]|nr:hypothetical protein K1719_038928 [Acacia pycnantha]
MILALLDVLRSAPKWKVQVRNEVHDHCLNMSLSFVNLWSSVLLLKHFKIICLVRKLCSFSIGIIVSSEIRMLIGFIFQGTDIEVSTDKISLLYKSSTLSMILPLIYDFGNREKFGSKGHLLKWGESNGVRKLIGETTLVGAVFCSSVALGFLALGRAGFVVNHTDVTPRYAGIVMGVSPYMKIKGLKVTSAETKVESPSNHLMKPT